MGEGEEMSASASWTWRVWPEPNNPPHKQVVAIVPGVGAIPGALVVSSDDNYSSDIAAKARLIAALPDLLEALRFYVEAEDTGLEDHELDEFSRLARAAIAKADGPKQMGE